MKTVKLRIADKLYQMETGPAAQVGDQVKMYLDTAANPSLPEFVFGIIQHPIKQLCEYTLYSVDYELDDYYLTDDTVLSVETTSAVDVVANDLLEEVERATAAEAVIQADVDQNEVDSDAADVVLQNNITAEAVTRAADDLAETNARIAADALKQDDLTDIGNVDVGTTTGASFGTGVTQKTGFHGAKVVQRAGAAQIAVPTTALTVSAGYVQAEVEAIIARLALVETLVNELRAADVEKGIIKGAA